KNKTTPDGARGKKVERKKKKRTARPPQAPLRRAAPPTFGRRPPLDRPYHRSGGDTRRDHPGSRSRIAQPRHIGIQSRSAANLELSWQFVIEQLKSMRMNRFVSPIIQLPNHLISE